MIGIFSYYLQFPFAQHALSAATVVAALCGFVGPFVITRRMSFAVHGTSELAFTGAVAGLLILNNPAVGALCGSILLALLIAFLGKKEHERDSSIGVVLAFGIALGILLLSFYHGFATAATNILFGNIFGIGSGELIILIIVALAAITTLAIIWRPLLFSSIDLDLAEARGIKTSYLGLVFLVILSFSATEAAQVVGTLLVLSLAITPAATAIRIFKTPRSITVASIAIAIVSADLGILLSLQFPSMKPSVLITAISFVLYLIARLYSVKPGVN